MEKYKNFKLASYVYAYYLDGKTPEQIQADIDFYKKHVPLNKVYLETHRALVNISEEQMRVYKKVFEDNGFEVSGGITTTVKVGEAKGDQKKGQLIVDVTGANPDEGISLGGLEFHGADGGALADPKNALDIAKYLDRRLKLHPEDQYSVYTFSENTN